MTNDEAVSREAARKAKHTGGEYEYKYETEHGSYRHGCGYEGRAEDSVSGEVGWNPDEMRIAGERLRHNFHASHERTA